MEQYPSFVSFRLASRHDVQVAYSVHVRQSGLHALHDLSSVSEKKSVFGQFVTQWFPII